MATYQVNVGQKIFTVDVTGNRISVDGKAIDASLTPVNEGGLFLLRQENRTREMHVKAEGMGSYAVMINGRHMMAQVEKGNARKRVNKDSNAQAGDLKAPMPGLVVNVLVKEGQHVENGEPLVVLESMKMQMQLRSPFAGSVRHIAVGDRMQVEKGALLVQVTGD